MTDFSDADLKNSAMAICQESCAFRGEPACWQIKHEGEAMPWPPSTCDDPGCVALAAAALGAIAVLWRKRHKPVLAMTERASAWVASVLVLVIGVVYGNEPAIAVSPVRPLQNATEAHKSLNVAGVSIANKADYINAAMAAHDAARFFPDWISCKVRVAARFPALDCAAATALDWESFLAFKVQIHRQAIFTQINTASAVNDAGFRAANINYYQPAINAGVRIIEFVDNFWMKV